MRHPLLIPPADRPTKAVLRSVFYVGQLERTWQTTYIETNERPLTPTNRTLQARFSPNQLNTYRLQTGRLLTGKVILEVTPLG